MFDIGFWELLLIGVIALVVVGPERLPRVAREVGAWMGKTRRFVEGVKSDIEREFDATELKRILHNQEIQIKELQGKLNQAQEQANRDIEDFMDTDMGKHGDERTIAAPQTDKPAKPVVRDDK